MLTLVRDCNTNTVHISGYTACQYAPLCYVVFLLIASIDVLLDSPDDTTFFDKVIYACGLQYDIARLPRGDRPSLGASYQNVPRCESQCYG